MNSLAQGSLQVGVQFTLSPRQQWHLFCMFMQTHPSHAVEGMGRKDWRECIQLVLYRHGQVALDTLLPAEIEVKKMDWMVQLKGIAPQSPQY